MTESQAKDILLRMVAAFPGLIDDTEVDGPYLVEWMTNELFMFHPNAELQTWAKNGTPADYEGPA